MTGIQSFSSRHRSSYGLPSTERCIRTWEIVVPLSVDGGHCASVGDGGCVGLSIWVDDVYCSEFPWGWGWELYRLFGRVDFDRQVMGIGFLTSKNHFDLLSVTTATSSTFPRNISTRSSSQLGVASSTTSVSESKSSRIQAFWFHSPDG